MAKSPKPEQGKAPATLPASIVTALPTAAGLMTHVRDIEKKLPQIVKELEKAGKKGAVELAKAFVVLHRAKARLDEMTKAYTAIFEEYKVVKVPEALDAEGLSNVPLKEGFRVQVSLAWRASIPGDKKDAAWEWLRNNEFESLITATVNASTLSAAAKSYFEDEAKEFPKDLFNVAQVPNTSVVKL